MEEIWRSGSGEKFTFEDVILTVREYILSDNSQKYEIIIGTDSQFHPSIKNIKYVTVISVRRVGKGARYFYRKDYDSINFSIKTKILKEALFTYEVLQRVKILISDILSDSNFISHLDIGENGKSKEMIEDVVSIFKGSGCEFKIKPDSFIASGVADKHSKNI
jgi:predicted RNase H-related nuclease YkuK (DUF458 family)